MKFDENSFNIIEAMAMSVLFLTLKGGNFIKMHYRVVSFGQNVALVIVRGIRDFILHFCIKAPNLA